MDDKKARHNTLRTASPILSHATESLWRAIDDLAVELALPAGQTLFLQGDDGDALYFVDEGAVEISVLSPAGRKLSLNVMRAGDVFGEIALLDASNRTATAATIQPTKLRRVQRRDLFDLMNKRTELAFEFIHLLCSRLRWVHELLEDRTFLPLPVRLAKRLLILMDQVGKDDGAIRISQADLADFLGATREGVAKVLASWRQRAWIELARSTVRIADRKALEGVAAALDDL